MKMEEHFKEALNRAVANEPPVLDAWDRFEQHAGRTRRVRLFAAIAAGVAIAVASVIVVPQLGTKEVRFPSATQPPASPSETADPYANFTSVRDQDQSWILRYPQRTWIQSEFEGVTYFQPRDVEPAMKGGPTFFISLQLRDEQTCPPPREFQQAHPNWECRQRPDGRDFYTADTNVDGTFERTMGIDWTKPCGDGSSCTPTHRTLLVVMHQDDIGISISYLNDAKLILSSIEYSDTPAG